METESEREIRERAEPVLSEIQQKYAVCAYPQNEAELPLCMEKYGFRDVSTEYLTVNLTPDNPNVSPETAHAIINANRQCHLDHIDSLPAVTEGLVTSAETEKLKRLANARYDEKIRLYDCGIRQWDTTVAVTMIVRGVKG